jgi:hypothetical protein
MTISIFCARKLQIARELDCRMLSQRSAEKCRLPYEDAKMQNMLVESKPVFSYQYADESDL